MGTHQPPTVKEIRDWRNNPHTSSMSDAIKEHAWLHRNKPKRRESKMCQACGAVSIIGGDRLLQVEENVHGAFYCDRECAESDRGRVYRTSETYRKKIDDGYAEAGRLRTWEKQVCKIHHAQCRVCNIQFCSRTKKKICSGKCVKKDRALRSWMQHRSEQSPKEVACAACGVSFTALVRTKSDLHWCGDKCRMRQTRKQAKHTRRERVRVACGVVRGKVSLQAQYRKYKGKCQLCGCKVVMSSAHRKDMATVDHIVPLSKGGLHVEDNVQLACWRCNTEKSDIMTQSKQMLLY